MNNLKRLILEKIFRLSSDIKTRKILRYFCIDNFTKFFYYQLFKPRNGRCFYIINGITAQFYVNSNSDFEYIMTGGNREYSIIRSLLKSLKPGYTIYDIGAFIGFHTVFFAKRVGPSGHIIALEPDSIWYETLCSNVRLNHLTNVIPLQVALGNAVMRGVLVKVSGGSLKVKPIPISEKYQNQTIEIVPGDLLVRDRKLPMPNVIKIDVEGNEYAVIQGLEETLKQNSCRVVCCEIHPSLLPQGVKPEMVVDLLKELGFRRHEIFHRGDGSIHIMCYKDY